MDWQQIAALTIVAVTAAVFATRRLRRRKSALPCDDGCGCPSKTATPPPAVTYKARKGERRQIVVKAAGSK